MQKRKKMDNAKDFSLCAAAGAISGAAFGLLLSASFSAYAGPSGFSEKVAASFAGKYKTCAKRLMNNDMPLRAMKLGAEADKITRNMVGNGYLVHFDKEKKAAWLLPLHKCKKMADKL